jgi:hypothetical protein
VPYALLSRAGGNQRPARPDSDIGNRPKDCDIAPGLGEGTTAKTWARDSGNGCQG